MIPGLAGLLGNHRPASICRSWLPYSFIWLPPYFKEEAIFSYLAPSRQNILFGFIVIIGRAGSQGRLNRVHRVG